MSTRASAVVLLLVAAAGLLFAAVSTFDFVQHLDRQVHDLHCSFAPGLVESDTESTGCQVTLLSPYSSVMRTSIWGGVPISLAAMSMFALLAFRSADLLVRPALERRTAASIVLVFTLIPVGASAVMATIALQELEAVCKLCIGIYVCSGGGLLFGLLAWRSAGQETALAEDTLASDLRASEAEDDDHETVAELPPRPHPGVAWLAAAGQLFAFVAIPIVTYAMAVPDHARFVGQCGGLSHPEDPYDVMVDLGGTGDTTVIEVFDPLCPACRGLEERLAASGLASRLRRRAVLFPLDSECNWMVDRSLHPGACRVSKAVLCAADNDAVAVEAVVQWAFDEQAALTEAGAADPDQVTQQVVAKFGALKACLSSAEVESRLNKSLRWTVANELSLLTPQVFIDGVKLCDEDTDLGLDFTLQRMLDLHASGALAAMAPAASDDADALVPGSEAPPAPDKAKPRKRRAKPRPKTAPSVATADDEPPESAPEKRQDRPSPETKDALPSVDALPPPASDDEEEGAP